MPPPGVVQAARGPGQRMEDMGYKTYRAGVAVKQRTGGVLTSRSAPATKSSAAGRSVVVGPARDGSGP